MEAIILLGLSPVGLFLVIFALLLISWDVFLRLRSKKKKTINPEIEKAPPGLGDYEWKYDTLDLNLYQSLLNEQILIREVRVFENKKEEKDKLIFASSLPFHFDKSERVSLKIVIPGLTEVIIISSHELMVTKSPAANFNDLRKAILTHLFIYLNRKYGWMKKPSIISLHYVEFEPNKLNCHMKEQTTDHVRLGILLGNVPGVTDWLNTTVAQMELKNKCQFDIVKEGDVEWADLLSKIQEVFRQYFTGGVEFVGPN